MMVTGVDVHTDAVAALATAGPSRVRTIARHCTDIRSEAALMLKHGTYGGIRYAQ